jgi:hypothetical protein
VDDLTLTPEEEQAAKIVEAALIRREHRYPDRRPRTRHNGTPWPAGKWDHEPDVAEWRARGFACLVVRHRSFGSLCGYVGVANGHPWHGSDYNSLPDNIDVHGGLTYSGGEQWEHLDLDLAVDEPGLWWVGFDCGHSGDFAPGTGFGHNDPTGYKTIEYVISEVERLVNQAWKALHDHLRR